MTSRDGPSGTRSAFGNYEILETVGQGGMGLVYRAQDTTLDRIVALKVLREDLRDSQGVVARFRREGEAFASLNHPNIVHIYSVGAVGKIPYIAMELVDGDPLSRILKRDRRVEWKRALEISEQIAEALASAHDAMIIHRDIKPGNILINKEGKAFVTDFGIAKVLTAETQLTIDGTRLGTPQYMSPERCKNGEVNAQSDIYSLGVVLFQMITGKLPYDAETPVSLVRQITHDPPKRIGDNVPDVPADVERLVAFMLEKNPRDRPSDAHSLARLIARVRSGKPIDEGESGLQSALNELRDTMTPTPSSYFDSASTSFDNIPFVARIRKRWYQTSDSTKSLLVSAGIILLAAFAGMGIASRLNEGYAINLVQRMEPGAERWQHSAMVAQYVDESSGVIVARVAMPGFQVHDVAWTSRGAVAAELRGRPETPRDGERAMLLFHPYRRIATILEPPVPSGDQSVALRLIDTFGGQRAGSALDGAFLMQPQGARNEFVRWRPAGILGFGEPLVTSGQLAQIAGTANAGSIRALAVALSPSGERLAVAVYNADTATTRLVEGIIPEPGAPPVFRALTDDGLEIDSVAYSPDAARIVYLRRVAAGGHELWGIPIDAQPGEGRKLSAGNLSFGRNALHPTRGQIAIVKSDPPDFGNIVLLDTESGAEIADLGLGAAVAWHPSGEFLLASARDRKDDFQMWRINASAPYDRAQLTFLTGGTLPYCGVSQNGAFACSTGMAGEEPFVVFVELPRQP